MSTVRTYGRTYDANGNPSWQVVQTAANGGNDLVWLTTLIQVLKLSLGEAPFYATYGIPAQQAILQQVFPDYYVTIIQQTFAPYFASLIISRANSSLPPTYSVNVLTHSGVTLSAQVAT